MFENEPFDELERELQDLGPLMAEQESLERGGPDPVFAAQLRSRLLAQAAERPQPRQGRRWSLPRLTLQWGGLAVGAIAAAAVLLLVVLRGGTAGNPTGNPAVKTAWVPPTPSTETITRGYPTLGGLGGGGFTSPTQSRLPVTSGGGPFPGRLEVTAGSLPSTPASVRAYRLRGPSFDVPRVVQIARTLGISGSVQRARDYEDVGGARLMSTWVVIKGGSGADMRSVAISTRTGRMIYHGGTIDPTRLGPAPGPGDAGAREIGQHLLIQIGWPVSRMPPGPPNPLPFNDPHLTYASFSWPGVTSADLPAAAFYVAHGPQVKEGLILPPVQDSTSLEPRSIDTAWTQVQSGKIPVGVEHAINVIAARGTHASGTGRVEHVTVTYVVTPGRQGTFYLVPAYRFSGTAHFAGVSGTYTWVAVVPAL